MPLWDYDTPPRITNPDGKQPVRTEKGWEDPDTGEVLIAIGNLDDKGGESLIASVVFGEDAYLQNDDISVTVHFVEKVDVTVGASIEVSWSGLAGNFFLNAVAQTGVYDVVFNKQMDNSTQEVVPSEAGTLSIAAQTLTGTIVDSNGGDPADLAISISQASAAGTRVVA